MNWAAVAAGYVTDAVTLDRLIQEVWRAAQSQEESNWRTLLKTDGVALCLEATEGADAPDQAVSSAARAIVRARQSSLATEVAKRALAQGFLASGGPRRGFAECLFGEVTAYLVSRDLPGYVGERFRNHTVREAVDFKDRITAEVRQRVAGALEERGVPAADDRQGWNSFIDFVAARLSS